MDVIVFWRRIYKRAKAPYLVALISPVGSVL